MDDLISRAEAVKTICGDCVWYNTASCEGEEWECSSVNKLRSLPSAETNKDKLPSAQTDIKQAAKSLLDFIESCLGGESYLITPDGENLRTDWGYVADGLQLIHEWADRSRRGADVRGGQDD